MMPARATVGPASSAANAMHAILETDRAFDISPPQTRRVNNSPGDRLLGVENIRGGSGATERRRVLPHAPTFVLRAVRRVQEHLVGTGTNNERRLIFELDHFEP